MTLYNQGMNRVQQASSTLASGRGTACVCDAVTTKATISG